MSEEQAEYDVDEQAIADVEAIQEPEEAEAGKQQEPEKEETPWYKRRIDELTRDKHEARRQTERLEKLVEQQEERLKEFAPKTEPVGIKPPNPMDFSGGQYDPRYMQAMLTYTRESAVAEAKQAISAEYEQRAQAQKLADKQSKLQTAEAATRVKYADYDGVIEAIVKDPLLSVNPTIRAAILETDNGPEIAYALGKNMAMAYELATMNPIQAGIKLASILANEPVHKGAAPKPVNPIKGNGGIATNQKELGDMSTSEYIAFMNAKEKAEKIARIKR